MCRLLGTIGLNNSAYFLRDTPCSLLAQSNSDPEHLQQDGWGVAMLSETGAKLLKSTTPVFDDPAFPEIEPEKGILIAHIRRASNPLKLPIENLRTPENIQPYRYGSLVFAHNGTINIPEEMKKYLGKYEEMLGGRNDSEIYFWLMMKNLEAEGDVGRAVLRTVNELKDAWETVPEERREKLKAPYRGLNFIMSDGRTLYAYCRHDGVPDAGPTLCYKKDPYYQMVYREENGGLVVASERMDNGDWKGMEDGELMRARIEDGKVDIKLSRVH